jgi:hypothetical protein
MLQTSGEVLDCRSGPGNNKNARALQRSRGSESLPKSPSRNPADHSDSPKKCETATFPIIF